MSPNNEFSEADECKDESTSCACNDSTYGESHNHAYEDSSCEHDHEHDHKHEVEEEEQFEELYGTSGTKKLTFNLSGMDCANCALSLQKALSNVDGMNKAIVSFGPRTTNLLFDGEKETFKRVEKRIKELGFGLEGERVILNLESLTSKSLGKKLDQELRDIRGILYADVSFKQSTITLIYNPSDINLLKIKSEIQKLGVIIAGEKKIAKISKQKIKLLQTAVTGTLFALGWATGWIFNTYGTTSLFLSSIVFLLSAVVIGGYSTVLKAFYSLRSKVLDVNTLVTIAIIGAIIIGEYWEASAVVFLFLFGSLLESYSMEKTRNAISELIDLKPKVAIVRRYETEVEVFADEVKKGEIAIVKAGEKIPVDGVVIKGGSTAVNQSSVTGESIPVEKMVGDEVFSGTINTDGYIEIETTKTGEDTTLSKIIKMVEKAQTEKAPLQTFAEKFDKYYVPAVILVALVNFLITQNLLVTLTLLVVACPCALVISTPVAIVSGIGNAARKGVLIKGGRTLETLGKLEAIAFDKTGTITQAKIKVFEVESFHDDISIKELLYWAGIGEKMAEHQIGKAIVEHVQAENITIPEDAPDKLSVVSGIGVTAEYKGRKVIMGKRKLLEDNGLIFLKDVEKYLQKSESKGYTVIPIGVDDRIIGAISVADLLKPEAPEALGKLKRVGIKKIVMLTGDNETTAETIAKCMEVPFKANLLPEDKVAYVKQLREEGRVVGMVGDGINDAPALAAADIGIAMGAAGTDVAIETADIALMSDDVSKVPYAIGLSKKTNAIIRQNIAFALVIVFVLLIATLFGFLELSSGILGHEASALLVILNGMRLLRYK